MCGQQLSSDNLLRSSVSLNATSLAQTIQLRLNPDSACVPLEVQLQQAMWRPCVLAFSHCSHVFLQALDWLQEHAGCAD